jgi:hypothetical protein
MKKVFFVFLFTDLFCLATKAQINLVINNSFEDTTVNSCAFPDGFGSWDIVSSTPDYFNANCWLASQVPQNYVGYENAHSGNGYAGIVCYIRTPSCSFSPNVREIMQGLLIGELKKGKKYCVEFWISVCDSVRYSVNNIGAFLSDTSYVTYYAPNTLFQMPFNRTPQIINDGASNPLTNKNGWTKIEGSFIAEGGEKYILIGNFNDDANSDTSFVGGVIPTNGGLCNGDFSYYYIDDVSVYCCDTDSCADAPLTIAIYPNPNNGEFIIEYGFNKEDTGELQIHNMLGQLVYKEVLPPYAYSKKIILPNIASGAYYVSVQLSSGYSQKQKIVLNK